MVFYVSTFRRMCAVPNMAVFCRSRTSWFPVYYYYYYYGGRGGGGGGGGSGQIGAANYGNVKIRQLFLLIFEASLLRFACPHIFHYTYHI